MFDRGTQVGAQLLAGGRYEHMSLSAVAIAGAALDVLAAAALGPTVAARPDTELAKAIAVGATPAHGHPPSPRGTIERLARLHGMQSARLSLMARWQG
ncbi:hypothetical protein [Pseudonocardia sp. ICBG162]|uniref:hypothetical protein n=1 Tax=Pseudonocardia sp. ICBG162 TaxID=2846761 RepID=UPI001CF6FBF9|nr:hypothetical protein [Pseudonocardia sp. ICBG162]